jgi:hypothetical protein
MAVPFFSQAKTRKTPTAWFSDSSCTAVIQSSLRFPQRREHFRGARVTLAGDGLAGFADDLVQPHEFRFLDERVRECWK